MLTPTGEVIQDRHSPNSSVRGIYIATRQGVEKFVQPENTFLVGIDGAQFVFLRQTSKSGDLLIMRTKSLTELQRVPPS